MVTGPTPGSLQKYSKLLGEHYRIPYINVESVLKTAKNLKVEKPRTENDFLYEDFKLDE